MTKKDYELIAGAIQWFKRDCEEADQDLMNEFSSHISNILAERNPLFNRDKFLQACGVTE